MRLGRRGASCAYRRQWPDLDDGQAIRGRPELLDPPDEPPVAMTGATWTIRSRLIGSRGFLR